MIDKSTWNIEIRCQSGTNVNAEIPVNAGDVETNGMIFHLGDQSEGDVRVGTIGLSIKKQTLTDIAFLEMNDPVKVSIPVTEIPEKITAFYLFNPWWSRPAFADGLADIPDKTQIALFKMRERTICLLPMVGREFKTTLAGESGNSITLKMNACLGGIQKLDEILFIMSDGATAAEAVHKVFIHLARTKGLRLRSDRTIPEMFRYLGWCSWDAFYTDVNENLLRRKAAEIRDKKIPMRWILIDDGWFGAEEKMLADLAPDKVKFPNGFPAMIRDIKNETQVDWFGVWHALGGYWDGVAPGSTAAVQESENLYENLSGHLVPDPQRGTYFYRDWYELLRREGIDFVKVDGQDAVPFYYKNCKPLARAARDILFSLESGVSIMNGAVINCMGMAMENVLNRPSSAISRNSDDFLPAQEESFKEHLLQNAYNSIYHNEIYCCDWDMFWTNHKYARKHSLLRAISGGPVYVSDRIGETNPEVLMPLVYPDGKLLMPERSARPTEDCIFMDPFHEGALKIHNIGTWGSKLAGGIAVYNLTANEQEYSVSPAEVPELDKAEEYWIYDFFGKAVSEADDNSILKDRLEADGYKWYVFLAKGENSSCLGLINKYVGFTAVENAFTEGNTDTVVLAGTGDVSWISAKKPACVMAGGKDVTAQMESCNLLHTLSLPESADRVVITVTWK